MLETVVCMENGDRRNYNGIRRFLVVLGGLSQSLQGYMELLLHDLTRRNSNVKSSAKARRKWVTTRRIIRIE